jgi:hypothetical protein
MVTAKAAASARMAPGHVRADERVAGGHEQLGFTGVDHLGDELGGGYVGHGDSLKTKRRK